MAPFPVSRFARNLFDFDNFFGPSLELFDPFDDHDLSLYSTVFPTIHWLQKPHVLDSRGRHRPQPEKFRITLNVAGIANDNIKTFVEGKKVVVVAKQENKCKTSGDFDTREFRKSFDIPENAIADQLTSFVTPNGILVIEIPLKVEKKVEKSLQRAGSLFDFDEFYNSTFYPKIVDSPDGKKKIEMSVDVKNFKPNDVHVSLKDNELIVKAESNVVDKGSVCKSTYYKQVTLPPGTNVGKLNSVFKDGVLAIEAPYEEPPKKQLEEAKK